MAENNNKPHGFTEQGARRVVDATRRVEQMPQDRRGRPNPPQPREGNRATSFWAMISGSDINGRTYSWMRAQPDGEGGFAPVPGTGGELNAYENNGLVGVPRGTVVRMFRLGQRDDGEPHFVFHHDEGDPDIILPIHDHRNNYNGGFAFAVYHPGTSLPQQPWAI